MQTVIDIGSHQIWQYVKTINELIKGVPTSRPGKINRKWPAARAPQPRKIASPSIAEQAGLCLTLSQTYEDVVFLVT